MSDQIFDTAIIGGSFAGLTATLHLTRARKSVALFDNGKTRNRFSAHAHNFIGQDGNAPAAIRMAGRQDALAYPSVKLFEQTVTTVTKTDDHFTLTANKTIRAKRLILAHGMRDILPRIDGLSDCWGKSVIQCPFCDGFEMVNKPTGFLLTNPDMVEHVLMLQNWTDDMILFQNGHSIADDVAAKLRAKGIVINERTVARIDHNDGKLSHIILENGESIAREFLYITPNFELSTDLATQLGCEMVDTPFGSHLKTSFMMQTSVPGVYGAGDVTRMMYGANLAVADGAMAGGACVHSLIYDPDLQAA